LDYAKLKTQPHRVLQNNNLAVRGVGIEAGHLVGSAALNLSLVDVPLVRDFEGAGIGRIYQQQKTGDTTG